MILFVKQVIFYYPEGPRCLPFESILISTADYSDQQLERLFDCLRPIVYYKDRVAKYLRML